MTRVFKQYQPPPPTGTTGAHKAVEPKQQPGEKAQAKDAQGATRTGDGFSEKVADTSAALQGVVTTRSPAQLAASARALMQASQLPEAFQTALAVHGPELTQAPNLTAEQGANRLFEFAGQFANRLTELTQAAPRPEIARAMAEALIQAGAQRVIDAPTNRTGIELSRQLFAASSPEQVRAMLEGLVLTNVNAQPGVPLAMQIQVAVPKVLDARESAETRARPRGTGSVLDQAKDSWRLLGDYVSRRSTGKWTKEERRLIARALGFLALVLLIIAVLGVLAIS